MREGARNYGDYDRCMLAVPFSLPLHLAWTFWSLGKKNEAIQLINEVVHYREKKIGSDYPHTVQSIQVL